MGEPMGTSGSASCYIYGDDFYAENITFSNTAGPVGQAVAALIDSDRAIFYRCTFKGFQDTLYPYGKERDIRQYYKECHIEGSVDFIFGWATAYFDNCTIHSKAKGYIAAPATRQETSYGFVFNHCKLTADEAVEKVYLGRPWREYGRAVYINCDMAAHIHPDGWRVWHNKKITIHPSWASMALPELVQKGNASSGQKSLLTPRNIPQHKYLQATTNGMP